MCAQDPPANTGSSRLSLSGLRSHFDIPSGPMCDEALERAYRELSEPIFNHSLRTFLYADWFSKSSHAPAIGSRFPELQTPYERELLFVACILHDLGTTDGCNGPCRFEVEGANAAADLVRRYSTSLTVDEPSIHQIWLSIALHSSGGLAENAGRLPLLVRSGVVLDFFKQERIDLRALDEEIRYESLLPRLDIELVLAHAVVKQALVNRAKAPRGSWPDRLVKGYEASPPDNKVAQDASLLAAF